MTNEDIRTEIKRLALELQNKPNAANRFQLLQQIYDLADQIDQNA